MKYRKYKVEQLDKIKLQLRDKEQILESHGYHLKYDIYCESNLNDNGEEVGDNVFIQITINSIISTDKVLDYYCCLCKNIEGELEEVNPEQFITDLLADIQLIEKDGYKAFKKIYARQIMERNKKLYPNQTFFSRVVSLSVCKSIILLFIIGIIGFLLFYIFFIN